MVHVHVPVWVHVMQLHVISWSRDQIQHSFLDLRLQNYGFWLIFLSAGLQTPDPIAMHRQYLAFKQKKASDEINSTISNQTSQRMKQVKWNTISLVIASHCNWYWNQIKSNQVYPRLARWIGVTFSTKLQYSYHNKTVSSNIELCTFNMAFMQEDNNGEKGCPRLVKRDQRKWGGGGDVR